MTDKEIDRQPADSAQALPPAIDSSRRRFTAASLAGSGLLMTLASRPALGTGICPNLPAGTTLSGWISGNQSANHKPTVVQGLSPGYWKNHNWPTGTGFPTKGTLYKDFFPGCRSPLNTRVKCSDSKTLRYPTMQDVVSAQIYNNEFGRSIVCAYLNALQGVPARPTPAEVKAMANLTFKPTVGAALWSEFEILCFLRQTFDSKSM